MFGVFVEGGLVEAWPLYYFLNVFRRLFGTVLDVLVIFDLCEGTFYAFAEAFVNGFFFLLGALLKVVSAS